MNRIACSVGAPWVAIALIASGLLGMATDAAAQREKVLHAFTNNGIDGYAPSGNLIFDKVGNLYGTTEGGGAYNNGTVFELVRGSGGGWTEKILYSFNPNGVDGIFPHGSPVFDSHGNLYGTTYLGGMGNAGTVFELITQTDGTWQEAVLHSFSKNGDSGKWPIGGLVIDAAGNLYGTTPSGGDANCSYGCGLVFQLRPNSGGTWTETILHFFSSNSDGYYPGTDLVRDKKGNLFGMTAEGGSGASCNGRCGTVFELSPSATGSWTESIVYNFVGGASDGQYPFAGLVVDAAGNLYGVAPQGGFYDGGVAFELKPSAGNLWTESVLYSFGGATDGANPYCTPAIGANGNLYGTTANTVDGYGAVFGLTPASIGAWTESLLFAFDNLDGWGPLDEGVVLDGRGNLYGSTYSGGHGFGLGVVYELTP